MKDYLGFALGILVGCVGLLSAQLLMKSPPAEPVPVGTASEESLVKLKEQTQLLTDAREKISELEIQLAASERRESAVVAEAGEAEAAPSEADEKEKAATFIETMMSLGDEAAKREIEKEVERLTEELGLSENQQVVVREALLKKMADAKAAGVRIATGQASIDDLIAADEHNFVAVDAAISAVLDADQLEQFTQVQEVREVERVETKTDQELKDLSKAAELTDEQQEAAWAVLAEINAGEKPGELPEGTTGEQFMQIVDEAIANRVNGLTPILNPEQLEVYDTQVGEFRTMITTLVGHATGQAQE